MSLVTKPTFSLDGVAGTGSLTNSILFSGSTPAAKAQPSQDVTETEDAAIESDELATDDYSDEDIDGIAGGSLHDRLGYLVPGWTLPSYQDYYEEEEAKPSVVLDDSSYVMLVASCASDDGKALKFWREFAYPLNEERVEAWTGLCNLKYCKVTTFKLCNEVGQNIGTFERHMVDDKNKRKADELKPGKCYLVVGYLDISSRIGYGG